MDSCLYDGREIYSWKLKDEDNQYDRALRGEWKRASEKHLLFCTDCGENVILRAGDIKEPHFAHIQGSLCPSNTEESFESMRGKRLLVNLAERSYPNNEIVTRKKLPDGNYCTVFVNHKNGLALDFHFNCLQNINYDQRSKYYIDNEIPFLHILSGCYDNKVRTVGATERDTVQSIQGYCVLLNMYPERNCFKIYYQLNEKHPKTGRYEEFTFEDRIGTFILNEAGELCYEANGLKNIRDIIEDYRSAKMIEYKRIIDKIEHERQEYERLKIKEEEQRRQREEKAHQEALEREREELIRRQKREEVEKRLQEEIKALEGRRAIEKRKDIEERKAIEEKRKTEEEIKQREIKAIRKKYYDEQLAKKLVREKISSQLQSETAVKLKIIQEIWELPPLLSRDRGVCSKKDDVRFRYMEQFEFWLNFADTNQKDILIRNAESRIDGYRFIDEWSKNEYQKDFVIVNKCLDCINQSEFVCTNKIISHGDIWCNRLHACFVVGKTCTAVKMTCEYCKHKEIWL